MTRPAPIQTSDAWALAMTAAPAIRRVVARLGRGDTDDLFQAGVLAAHVAAQRYDPERGPFLPYALWYVRGAVWRQLSRECKPFQVLEDVAAEATHEGPMSEWLTLVEELPVIQAEVVALRLQGYRWEEVGKRTGVSVRTTKRRMAAAVAALKARR